MFSRQFFFVFLLRFSPIFEVSLHIVAMRKCSQSIAAIPIRSTFDSCAVWSRFLYNKLIVLDKPFHDIGGAFERQWWKP